MAEPVVFSVVPASARTGQTVQVHGSGFSETASENTVTINDEPVAIGPATSTQLTLVIPSTATSGALRVTTPGGTAEAPSPLVVTGVPAVAISQVDPNIVAPGDR